ncbi:MAG: ATP synthase subunit I [Oscillospiraceae bacterium]|jgi:predicted PurR-regulated permease PerM
MKLSEVAKRMILTIGILTLLFIAAAAVYYRSPDCLPFVFGALLGSATSIAKVILLERAVDRALGMEKDRAGNYVRLQHLLRLALSGAVLVLAALVPNISLWGAVAGILSFQISLYTLKMFKKI